MAREKQIDCEWEDHFLIRIKGRVAREADGRITTAVDRCWFNGKIDVTTAMTEIDLKLAEKQLAEEFLKAEARND